MSEQNPKNQKRDGDRHVDIATMRWQRPVRFALHIHGVCPFPRSARVKNIKVKQTSHEATAWLRIQTAAPCSPLLPAIYNHIT